jgi:hypothetical protein
VLGAVVRQVKGGRMAQHLRMQRDADVLNQLGQASDGGL